MLQRRSKDKKSYPNCWALCAGHVVGTQTTLEAAVNEANEELGLNLTERDLTLLVNKTRNEREDNKCFATCFYKIINKPLEYFNKQDEEVDELKWFSIKEFTQMVLAEDENQSIFKNNEYYNNIIQALNKLKEQNYENS